MSMRNLLKQVAPKLRAIGFRGTGQNYRKVEGDYIFIVNFQGSRKGDRFYVNLGAQPGFIPSERLSEQAIKNIKEYECIFRKRVSTDWPWDMKESDRKRFDNEFDCTQKEFFGHVQTLRSALANDSPEKLLKNFNLGTTEARSALHLARGCFAIGNYKKTEALAIIGLELASKTSITLRDQLNALLIEVRNES